MHEGEAPSDAPVFVLAAPMSLLDVLAEGGVGVTMASTSLVSPVAVAAAGRGFASEVGTGRRGATVGDAFRAARAATDPVTRRTLVLLGDPSAPLPK